MKNNKYLLAKSLMEICEKKPLDYVTVTEITKSAGLTRQVFYHHFVDKYELAKWVHLYDFAGYIKNNGENLKMQISGVEIVCEWLRSIEKHKKFYHNAYHSIGNKEFQLLIRKHIFDSYKYVLEKVYANNMSDSTLFSLQVFTIGASEKMFEWIKEEMPISASVFCKYIIDAMPLDVKKAISLFKVSKQELISLTKMTAQKCEVEKKSYMS